MSNLNVETSNESGPGRDFTAEEVMPDRPAKPAGVVTTVRAGLAAVTGPLRNATQSARKVTGPTVQNWCNRASHKAAPVLDRARAHRVPVLSTLAAVAALLAALPRRRADEPVIDESMVDLGVWHVTGQPYRLDESA